MKHKAPAADLRGGKASADSLTPRRISLAAEDAKDLRADLFLDTVLGSTVSSELFVRFLFFPNQDLSESEVASRSVVRRSERLGGSRKRNIFAYRRVPDLERRRGQVLTKLRDQCSQDLELTL